LRNKIRPFLRKFIQCFLVVLSVFNLAQAERKVTEKPVGPGCTFIEVFDPDQRLGIYVFKVDLSNEYIKIDSVLAHDSLTGRETVLNMSQRKTRPRHQVVGAVNADYFYVTAPSGFTVNRGHLSRSSRGWAGIAFSENNKPLIAVFRDKVTASTPDGREISSLSINRPRNDSNVVLYTGLYGDTTGSMTDGKAVLIDPNGNSFLPQERFDIIVDRVCSLPRRNIIPPGKWVLSLGGDFLNIMNKLSQGQKLTLDISIKPDTISIYNAVSGGPRILRSGKVSVESKKEGQRKGFDREMHPRTAVGYSRDKRFLVMAVIDGRQPGYSRGVDLYELAAIMLEFGCYEALNLDGGGSSTLVICNKIVNHPSDPTGPRPVANALLVISTAPGSI